MALAEVLINLGIDVDDRELKSAEKTLADIGGKARQLAAQIASAFSVGAVGSFINSIAAVGDELADTAERLGVGAQSLEALQYAAERAGASPEALNSGLQILSRNLGLALQGGAQAAEFRRLGVSIKDSAGNALPMQEVLEGVAEAAANARTPAERAAVATRLLGRGGAALAPLLARGARGVRGLTDRFEELGGGMSENGVDASSEFKDGLQDLNVVITSIKSAILVGVMPVVRALFEAFGRVSEAIRPLTQNTNVFGVALVGILGTAIALNANLILMALAIGAVVVVVDDLVTFIQGGDSALGRFIDTAYGLGTAQEVAATFRDTWASVTEAISGAWDMLKGFIDQAAEFADGPIGQFIRRFSGVEATSEAIRGSQNTNTTRDLGAPLIQDLGAGVILADGVRQRTSPPGGDSTTVRGGDTHVTINGAQNPAEVGRQAGAAVTSANSRHLRQLHQEVTSRRRAG